MSHPSVPLERTSSVPRRSSLIRPTLPSLASWTTPSSFTPTKLPTLHPPTSAGSTSSLEADEAVTPGDGPSFPPPPSHLKMLSPNPSHEGDFSPAVTVKAPLAEFRVQDIPPFRGGGGGGNSANLQRRPSTAGAPPPSLSASAGASIPPSALPTSLAAAHPEGGYRRASVASVFSLPRPNPPSASSSASTAAAAARQSSQPAPVTMGLGIAGVGVGQSGQREALVIERLGEPNSHGRRGSLKRVLVSEDDDEQDLLRASLGSRESDRSRMDGSDSSIPLPLQQPSVLTHAHSSRREGSPLNPSSAAARRAGSSSPPQPGSIARNYSTAATTGRDSPTASKRARTALSPLESLAATATNLLAAPSVSSSSSTNSLSGAAPPRPSSSSSSVSNVLSSFMLGQPSAPPSNREQAEAYEATQRLREQYERRKELQPPAPGSLGAALGKLRATAKAEGMGGSSSSEVRGGGGNSRSKSAIPAVPGEGGLGKRRGHRPPAVNTASSSNAGPSSFSARSHHPYPPPSGASLSRAEDTLAPLRSATALEIPSVLVGSPVDPSFAARAARELAPMRTAQTGPTRKTSRSGASSSLGAGAEREERRERERERDERPYPSVVQVQQQQSSSNNQPPLVSSSTYYIRPNQPLGPGVPFPSTSNPSASSSSNNKALPPPPPSAGPRLPSFTSTARASPPQPAFHPLHQQRPTSSGGGGGGGGPLSPLAPIRNAPPPAAHSSAPLASPAQYASAAPPFHIHHPPPQSAPVATSSASASSASASKTAFLSLFSTFYDSLSDSRILSSTLETQISRASQLLHTLQHAETVLERMVDERVGRVERGWEERLRGVEGRLGALEAQQRRPEEGVPLTSATLAVEEASRARTPLDERRGSGESAETAITSASGVEERLDRIEKQLADATAAAVAGWSREREREGEGAKEKEAEGEKAVEGREEEMPAQA